VWKLTNHHKIYVSVGMYIQTDEHLRPTLLGQLKRVNLKMHGDVEITYSYTVTLPSDNRDNGTVL